MADSKEWSEEKELSDGKDSTSQVDDLPGGNGEGSSAPKTEATVSDTEQTSPPAQEIISKPAPPPNGGYGWVITLCSATINAHTWGLNSSYGVFLAHYLRTNTFPGATTLDYAFVGSLSISCAMFISPVATTCTRYFGSHTTLFIGVILETTSLIGASFVKEIWQLFLSQGVCFGLGMGFLFIGSIPIVPQWFTTKRSLAAGVSAAGSGIGGLVYSLATGAMIDSIGLPWAFRVLGIITFVVNSICSALMRDRNKIIGSSLLAFDTNILVRLEYILLGLWGWFSMLGYVVLIFSLANYANAIGLNSSQAALISALFNLGQFLGRPPIGYFSDTVGRINMAMATTFVCGFFALVIWIFAKSYGVLIFYAIIGGTCAGTFWTCIAPVTAEIVGLRHVPSGLNLMWLTIGLPVTFSEPIALEIVDGTHSYLGTQLWTGFMYIAGSVCLLFLRGWKLGELEEVAKMRHENVEDLENVEAESPLRALKAGRKTMLKHMWKWRKV
ncbi:major facilitator superfamily domain-containing protein [Neohortaea acidophila]|uniref:Major facilitator superfamily domain-containing protein n=1 Tax=Neohortaea acidophila TaxID=245834 RepID=A0A6A6Q568_9PEZI|nr:major facilitator superfamily domain-containing protein [Neohortaea acidophila]KAF2486783.1 major facilitator superfamily domain-containing protein [Neohortaea acidophila]